MKKGLSDAVFIPEWSTETFLKEAGEAGFSGVELNVREDEGELTLQTSPSEARYIVRRAKAYRVDIPSLSTGLFNVYSLASGDRVIRNQGEDIASRMIRLAAEMEVPIVQAVPGVITSEEPYEDAYERSKDSLYRLGEEAAASGVTIAIENVSNKFLPSPLEFTRFLKDINHPSVQAYFDNGNAMVTGHPEHFISLLGDRIVAMHVKDYKPSVKDFVNTFDGNINWPEMMKALATIPYTGYLIATPPYASFHSQKRLVQKASADLSIICELSGQPS
ncbi:sugar phosphate isomerase/epimerase family protein [Natribacillus halophilus]|uniref:Hexulose-6-phosphate isomerase n=1 Tax=Natribacillus halophilus TaxID=549003 RepID=A0A1G8LYL7_9BACI|nr:sugar phosphate isomerase/epimerase family protein [Natribacillus halophilus]SDI60791.1 hexulose-6-phosphate isomerase [Natribacillus halophilus]